MTLKGTTAIMPFGTTAPGFVVPKFVVPTKGSTPGEADALRLIFGEQEQKDWNTENIDWNAVDSQLTSQRILVTRPEINGKKL